MGRLYRWVDTQLSKDEEMASGLGLVDLGQWRRLSNRYDSRIAVKLQGGASQSESTQSYLPARLVYIIRTGTVVYYSGYMYM